jgi:hypothetical protein
LKNLSLFNDKIKIPDKCTFSDGWLQNFKECHGSRKVGISGEVPFADVEVTEQYSELFQKK